MLVRSGLVIFTEAAALQQHAHMLLYARLGARRGRAGRGGKERQTDIARKHTTGLPDPYTSLAYAPCLPPPPRRLP